MAERNNIREFGTQLSFNGTSDQVNVDNASFGSSLSQISFSAWIKPKAWQGFVVSRPAGTSDQFGITSAGLITVSLNIGGIKNATGISAVSKSTWTHIAATYDGTNIKIYKNGVLEATTATTGSLTNTGINWDIGHRGGTNFFSGKLDEVLIFNKGLTDVEVNAVYTSSIIPRNNLLAEYLCNEGSGSTLIDTSSNGNNGAITGATYITDEPLTTRNTATSRNTASNRKVVRDMGTALRFDGANDWSVSLGVINELSNAITVSAWISPTALGQRQIIGNRADTQTSGFYFHLDSIVGRLRFGAGDGTNYGLYRSNTAILPTSSLNQWSLVTAVYDAGTVTFYVNNISYNSSLFSGTGITGSISNSVTIPRIGRYAISNSYRFSGIIDEPRIWNRALTAQEISDLYFNNIVPQDGLVAEYLFNEASGTTAFDTSGNGNDGTITGATYTTDTPFQERDSI